MGEGDRSYPPVHKKQMNRTGRDETKKKPLTAKDFKIPKTVGMKSKAPVLRTASTASIDLMVKTDTSSDYKDIVAQYMDDMDRGEKFKDASGQSEEVTSGENSEVIVNNNSVESEFNSVDRFLDGESDSEMASCCASSPSETQSVNGNRVRGISRVPRDLAKKDLAHTSCLFKDRTANGGVTKLHFKSSPRRFQLEDTDFLGLKSENMKMHTELPPESLVDGTDKVSEETKEIYLSDEAPDSCQSVETVDDITDNEVDGSADANLCAKRNLEEMERRIEQLEEELREIAALELSLYSVVPEHGSSAHKLHAPARRLSRLYIHACKCWTLDKRASIARNSVSGLVLIAKSCGSDAARLTFWWSNIIVLRDIISQVFGCSGHTNLIDRGIELFGGQIKTEEKSVLKWNTNDSRKHRKMPSLMQPLGDWQETSTYICALKKIESWIFSRTVESTWWQVLTPHMQLPVDDSYSRSRSTGISGSVLSDDNQGIFSIDLWKDAFRDVHRRLCPVRAVGHECGCLSVLSKMVIEQLVDRLDVAMFNAILRESAHEIPTDPVSDPVVDPRVLPIPAGHLSFGSGAHLKNSVGNWSRFLTDLCGMDTTDSPKGNLVHNVNDDEGMGETSKSFRLLNALSDLLMLPKDMLVNKSIREEVCPTFSLTIIKRILCNFTPDEFCPDVIPGSVLEAINSQSILEKRLLDKDSISSFPCTAPSCAYHPPSATDISERVGDIRGHGQLERSVPVWHCTGYTSDEELDELNSPIASVIDKMSSPSGNTDCRKHNGLNHSGGIVRYKLLREIWSS